MTVFIFLHKLPHATTNKYTYYNQTRNVRPFHYHQIGDDTTWQTKTTIETN